jgi:predicted nuclease of restriction endonuclease-like (RecB) superfamily
MAKVPAPRKSTDIGGSYEEWLESIKQRIRAAQARAAHAVNAELITAYWDIGGEILRRQGEAGNRRGRGGPKIVERLSADLQADFPRTGGFGVANLRYMRAFAAAWPREEMLQHGVGALPWGHITVLLDKLDDQDQRQWYAARAAHDGWTRKVLEHHIATKLHEREGAVISNFEESLPLEDAKSAALLLRDPTVIDFVDPDQISKEKDLEDALAAEIEKFMLALGAGFLYAGRQRNIDIAGQERRLDLLFYHHPTSRWVVVDLKIGAFESEFSGKMNLYVNAVDEQIAAASDKPTVGFILCADRNEAEARLALKGLKTPMAVGRYVLGESGVEATAEPVEITEGMENELADLANVERQVAEFTARRTRELTDADGDEN